MTAKRPAPVVALTLGALVVAFAIAFGLGKLTKKSTAAAIPAKTQIVSRSSDKPSVPRFEDGGSIPALKTAPKRNGPAPAPTPTPKPAPAPAPKEKPKVVGDEG